MFTSLVKKTMQRRPDAMNILVDIFAKDCGKLIEEGVTSADGTKRLFLLHLATKGDLPALVKLVSATQLVLSRPKHLV